VRDKVIAFEPEFLEARLSEKPPFSMLPGMLWRLHWSIGDIAGCLSDECARGRPSSRQSRARVLGQFRRAGPRCGARILVKEMLKQHCGEQCDADKSGTSKHSARPGGDLGLIGLSQLNMKMWSHDLFFPCDHRMRQSICSGECGLRKGDSIGREKFPLSGAKMKLKDGNNSARAEVMEMSCAVYPQDQAA
jgi:hypothetical protein